MDKISRKQRQLERKYDNLRRIAANEEKYSSNSSSSFRTTARSPMSLKVDSSAAVDRDGGGAGKMGGGNGLAATYSGHLRTGSEQALDRSPATADARSVSADPIKRFHQSDQSGDGAVPERSLPVFIAIQDYVPEPGKAPEEALPLDQGQIVEVLDNKNPANWLVRTKAKPPQTGWVPGSYFETPTKYYTQRKTTRELAGEEQKLSEQQQALLKREQVFHDLLRTEEEFARELRIAVEHYVKAFDNGPGEVRERQKELSLNLSELSQFHTNVMVKGLQYYSDDPGKVGQTFVRVERDFEQHVAFMRELGNTQRMMAEIDAVSKYVEKIKQNAGSEIKEYKHYMELVPNRIEQYGNFFKEIIKYMVRANQNTDVMQKALELIQSIPMRAQEIEFTKNLINYPGDVRKLGRIFRHELFDVWEGEEKQSSEKYIFLFRNKIMLTERDTKPDPPLFLHYATIRVDKYTVRQHTREQDTIVVSPNESGGLPLFLIAAHDVQSREFVRRAWLRDIVDMQTAIGGFPLEDVEEEDE